MNSAITINERLVYTNKYDYVIIGGGPSGLTCAWLLSNSGYKCAIIDKNSSLGGCHRSLRINGLWCEHGPRYYTDAYKTMNQLHNNINAYLCSKNITHDDPLAFDKTFAPFEVSVLSTITDMASILSLRELAILASQFTTGGKKDVSVEEFVNHNEFSPVAKKYIDRLCRLTDGADSGNTSMYKFTSTASKGNLYILRHPSDEHLFKWWEIALRSVGVDIYLNSDARIKIWENSFNIYSNKHTILGKNVICAIPPQSLVKIIPIYLPRDYMRNHSYISYYTVVFHWNHKLSIIGEGLPTMDTKWGIAYTIISKYFSNEPSTIISVLVSIADQKGSLGKSALKSSTNEIIYEVFFQLCLAAKISQKYDYAIVSSAPGDNPSYVDSIHDNFKFGPMTNVPGLYSVGTHNGNSQFGFTTFESACENARAFCDGV